MGGSVVGAGGSPTLNNLDCRATPSGSFTGGNGLSTIDGSAIGSGQFQNADLRKQISVTQLSGATLFSAGQSFALRSYVPQGVEPSGFSVVIPITNISGGPFCLVDIGNVVYRDTSGSVLEGPSTLGSAILGSHGTATWSISSQPHGPRPSTSCLASGEVGYFVSTPTKAHFSQVAKVEFDICAGGIAVAEAQTNLHALSYQWTSGGVGLGKLTVTVKNQGSIDAVLGPQSEYIVFDAGSLPVYVGFLYQGQGTIAPGASLAMGASDPGASIGGTGTRLLFAIALNGAP